MNIFKFREGAQIPSKDALVEHIIRCICQETWARIYECHIPDFPVLPDELIPAWISFQDSRNPTLLQSRWNLDRKYYLKSWMKHCKKDHRGDMTWAITSNLHELLLPRTRITKRHIHVAENAIV